MALCNYDVVINGCFLEIEKDGKIVYNFSLAALTWVHKADDKIVLSDCCSKFQVDIDCLNGYATIDDFIAFIEPLRAACMASETGGATTGADCDNPTHVENCVHDAPFNWCESVELCNVTEAGLTNGNPVLYDAISLDISGLSGPYHIFSTTPGEAASEAARLEADLIALGYGATVRPADPPTDTTIDLTITGLTQAVVPITWVDFDLPNDTILTSINCVGTGVNTLITTWYVFLRSDGTQRWVNASDFSDVSDVFPPTITGGKLCDPVAENLKSINRTVTAPCGSEHVQKIELCNVVLRSECFEDPADGCDYTIADLPVNGNTFTEIVINGVPYIPVTNVNFDGTNDWGKMDALEAELIGLGYTIIPGTRIGTDPTVLTNIEGWGIYSTTDVFNQVTYKAPAPAVPFVESQCGLNRYTANYFGDGSLYVFNVDDPGTNLGAINPNWIPTSCDPGLKAIEEKLNAECSDAQNVKVCNVDSCLFGIPTDHCREMTINLDTNATVVNDDLTEIQVFIRSVATAPPFNLPLNYPYNIASFTDRTNLVADLIALGHNVEIIDLGGFNFNLVFYNTPYDVSLVGFGELDPAAVCSEIYKDIFPTHFVNYCADGSIQNIELATGTAGTGVPAGTLAIKPQDPTAYLSQIAAKLAEPCGGSPINVNVCNQINLSGLQTSLDNILTQVTAIEGNTDTIEASLTSIITELQGVNVDTDQILLDLDAVISELQAIDVNTDGLETQLTAIQNTITAEGDQTQALLQSILDKLNAPCATAQKVEVCPATTVDVVPTHATTTTTGSTAASVQSVTVCNIGTSDGLLGGATLARGQCVTYSAYLDPVTNEYKRLGAITYDATGTEFTISTLA